MKIENVVELTVATDADKSGPITIRDRNGTLIDVLEGKVNISGNVQIRLNGNVVPNSQLADTPVTDGDQVLATPQVKAG